MPVRIVVFDLSLVNVASRFGVRAQPDILAILPLAIVHLPRIDCHMYVVWSLPIEVVHFLRIGWPGEIHLCHLLDLCIFLT